MQIKSEWAALVAARPYMCTTAPNWAVPEVAVFTRPQANAGPVPVLTYLSGLTCTWENVTTKAGFQAWAAEAGVIVVCPDTSPRAKVPDATDEYDFGQGAGFYVNATREPWAKNYRMYAYVVDELPRPDRQHGQWRGHASAGYFWSFHGRAWGADYRSEEPGAPIGPFPPSPPSSRRPKRPGAKRRLAAIWATTKAIGWNTTLSPLYRP